MLLRDFLFSMLIISAVILGYSSFWTDLSTRYGVAPITNDLSSFYQINRTLSVAQGLQGNVTGIGAMLQNIPIIGSFASVLIAGTQVLVIMFEIPGIFMTMINSMGSIIGLPVWFTSILWISIVITVIFAIIGQSVIKGRV